MHKPLTVPEAREKGRQEPQRKQLGSFSERGSRPQQSRHTLGQEQASPPPKELLRRLRREVQPFIRLCRETLRVIVASAFLIRLQRLLTPAIGEREL